MGYGFSFALDTTENQESARAQEFTQAEDDKNNVKFLACSKSTCLKLASTVCYDKEMVSETNGTSRWQASEATTEAVEQ